MTTIRQAQKEVTNMLKYGVSVTLSIGLTILLFIWVGNLW